MCLLLMVFKCVNCLEFFSTHFALLIFAMVILHILAVELRASCFSQMMHIFFSFSILCPPSFSEQVAVAAVVNLDVKFGLVDV